MAKVSSLTPYQPSLSSPGAGTSLHAVLVFLCIWTNTHLCIHSHECVQALRCSRSCYAAALRLRARQVQVGGKKRLKKDAG